MQALLAVMERVSSGIAISLPNLMVILATELHSFLVTHQPNLIGYERPILDSLCSFFSRYIFPLVSSWLGNFCSVFTQELHSPLVIEKSAFSPISDEDLNKIRNLIKNLTQSILKFSAQKYVLIWTSLTVFIPSLSKCSFLFGGSKSEVLSRIP